MEIYKKINQAIGIIKNSDLKKDGRNIYSEYDYFTPAQVDELVHNACIDLDILNKFELKRNELGIEGHLTVINISDANDFIHYVMASDIPSIKATNISQQLGGAMTYTKRYMLMNAYEISDNNLDPDNTDNTQKRDNKSDKKEPENWLNKYNKDKTTHQDYWTIVNGAKEKGLDVKGVREFYKISKIVAVELEEDLK